ncbi:DUF6261 family protein [Hoylesella marshii]|uniref:Hemagglutinin protein HagB n=1 Tax=Hoylesella marshii DSM 16973 = JCM 13450 TaxID=862515 RepID=E0NS11_9BACT|nr:DUF6261 family protein [Hoylesella marshii]EFM02105.1 hypothetical protein HMPREF0658_0962 [Hoylesella marshii DSM 16973 = JCM 13450]
MRPIKTIDGTLSSTFSLGLHADLQMRLYAAISPVAPAKILLEAADIAAWQADIEQEKDVARAIMASSETALMTKKDAERDRIVTSLFQEIRQASKSPIADRAQAGARLKLVADAYKGLQWEADAEETAHIEGLLYDLAKPMNDADLTALGLNTLVDLLTAANKDFNALRTQRSDTKALDKLPAGKLIRKKNDTTMNALFRHIEAAYIVAANDADRTLIGDLIDKINHAVKETKTTHNESMAQKKKDDKDKKPGDGDKKPGDDGKKPSDGDKKPDDGGKKPDDGDKKPDGGGKKPDDGGKKPDGGGAGPVPSDPLPMIPKE